MCVCVCVRVCAICVYQMHDSAYSSKVQLNSQTLPPVTVRSIPTVVGATTDAAAARSNITVVETTTAVAGTPSVTAAAD